jgi:hypothetical protein
MDMKRLVSNHWIGEFFAYLYMQVTCKLGSGVVKKVTLGNISRDFYARNEKMKHRIDKLRQKEASILSDFMTEIAEEDLFYDIGADFGLYTLFASSKIPENQIFAFEPYRPRVGRMRANLRLNGQNPTIIRKAIGNDKLKRGYKTTFKRPSPYISRINDIKNLPHPSIVKIDVDGGEYNVIEEIEPLLRKYVRVAYIEIHPHLLGSYDVTDDDVIARLKEMGFYIEKCNDSTGDQRPYFVKGSK